MTSQQGERKRNLDFGFICAGVNNVGGYRRNARYICLLQTFSRLNSNEKLSISWRISWTRAWSLTGIVAACMITAKPQALVYDILPSATATIDYAIGLEKLSATDRFPLVPKQH